MQLRDAVDQVVMGRSCAMVLLSGVQEEAAGAISLEELVAEIKQNEFLLETNALLR